MLELSAASAGDTNQRRKAGQGQSDTALALRAV
jgi:hypothetical protein